MKDPAMDYDLAAENIRASYREVTSKYRDDDEIEVRKAHKTMVFAVAVLLAIFAAVIYLVLGSRGDE